MYNIYNIMYNIVYIIMYYIVIHLICNNNLKKLESRNEKILFYLLPIVSITTFLLYLSISEF